MDSIRRRSPPTEAFWVTATLERPTTGWSKNMARRARSIGAHLPIKNNTPVYTFCCYGFKRTVLFPGPVLDVAYANGPLQTEQRSCVRPTPHATMQNVICACLP